MKLRGADEPEGWEEELVPPTVGAIELMPYDRDQLIYLLSSMIEELSVEEEEEPRRQIGFALPPPPKRRKKTRPLPTSKRKRAKPK